MVNAVQTVQSSGARTGRKTIETKRYQRTLGHIRLERQGSLWLALTSLLDIHQAAHVACPGGLAAPDGAMKLRRWTGIDWEL
jgi:hypothetical protein